MHTRDVTFPMPKKRKNNAPRKNTEIAGPFYLKPAVLIATVSVLILVCFFPITKYYFAQDDFILLKRAAYEGSSSLAQFLGSTPGQFRPLSKVAYFVAMYRLFDLNPFPFHVVSLLLHVFNVILFFRLLTKLKIATSPALAATALFGLSVTVLNVVGWISCVQQLLGECFMLLSLLYGLSALQKPCLRNTVLSIVAYVLAVMSMEQTYAVPLILFLIAFNNSVVNSGAGKIRDAAGKTAPHLTAFVLFLGFMLFWKGIPSSGDYTFILGGNVVANLMTYLDRVFQFSVIFPFQANVASAGITASHLFFFALVFYNIARGRGKQTLLAIAIFTLTMLPALFLENHVFYLHLYIPSLGILYLLALAFDDFFELLARWNAKVAAHTILGVFLIVSVMSYTAVRTNETSYVRSDFEFPNNFVFRKAVIAKNALEAAEKKTNWTPINGNLYLISISDIDGWYSKNVVAALGRGDAFRLFYDDPGLKVVFLNKGETIQGYDSERSLILIFDDKGHLYTTDDAEKELGRPIIQQKTPE